MAFKVSIAPHAIKLLIVYLMSASLRSLSSASATHPAMKRTSSSPATGVVAGSDTNSDKKQRTTQDNGSTTTEMPMIAEKTTIETISAAAASDETTGEATPAASDGAGYVSDSLQADSDDDSSITDLLQWSPEDDEESLPDQDQQSYLCSRCREIDLDEILSRTGAKKGGDPIMSFSDEERVLRDPECVFCQAIQFIYPSLEMRGQSSERSSWLVAATVDDQSWVFRQQAVHPGRKVILTFAQNGLIHRWNRDQLEKRSIHLELDAVGYLAEQQTIDCDCAALPAALVKPHADLDFIKRKLDECPGSHSRCKNERREDDRGVPCMRLIDCETRTVVPAPKRGCTYAALSYVWGTSKSTLNPRSVFNNCHEELPADLPHTISDAMLVALRLKIRYLWCDRYCIQQNPRSKEEKDEKHGQIARMCDIYNRASVTIIAAAGDGPDYGLPGVSSKRQQPPRVCIGSRTLFATFPDPQTRISRSKWSTRGWTFQEGLLARRRLVFTDQQVYFQCAETGVFEAYDRSGEINVSLYTSRLWQPGPVYPYFCMGHSGAPDIWLSIDKYAGLTLGNTQDILDAFLGVLNYYEEVAYPRLSLHARNVAGLPMQTAPCGTQSWPSELFIALGWPCDMPARRRDGFPSWSWIGWYCKGFSCRDGCERFLTSGKVRLEGPNNEILEQDELHRLIEARHDFSYAKYLRVTAPCLKARIISHVTVSNDEVGWLVYFSSMDNTKRRRALRYSGLKELALMNLSDERLLDADLPYEGLECFAIILDEDDPHNPELYSAMGAQFYAATLIVVENEDGFERVGVSGVDREELKKIDSSVREFRLM